MPTTDAEYRALRRRIEAQRKQLAAKATEVLTLRARLTEIRRQLLDCGDHRCGSLCDACCAVAGLL